MKNQEAIDRKEFLRRMGFGGAALMAVLTSCGSAETVTPSGTTIDLSTTTALSKVGGYVKTGNVIVARIASGDTSAAFAAVARICPHENKDRMVYQASIERFVCTEHQWMFKTNGKGDGNGSITAYTVTLSGTTLTIS